MKVQEKNITKTKTKRLISESLRKNITKTKTKRIISEINHQQQQQPYTLTPEQQPQYE